MSTFFPAQLHQVYTTYDHVNCIRTPSRRQHKSDERGLELILRTVIFRIQAKNKRETEREEREKKKMKKVSCLHYYSVLRMHD